jgi:hypothetical protein
MHWRKHIDQENCCCSALLFIPGHFKEQRKYVQCCRWLPPQFAAAFVVPSGFNNCLVPYALLHPKSCCWSPRMLAS